MTIRGLTIIVALTLSAQALAHPDHRDDDAPPAVPGIEPQAPASKYSAANVIPRRWHLHLSSEQVWNGDTGGSEASAPTQPIGLDLEGSTDLTAWLSLDANFTFAQASFVANHGNGGAVALAPSWMGSGGVTAKRGTSFVALRCRGIADRAGDAAGTLIAPGYLIFDLIAGTQRGAWGANVTVANLTNSPRREGVPLTAIGELSYAW